MKILVFGSGGYLGRCLTARAKQRGLDVETASSSLPIGLDSKTGLLRRPFRIPHGTEAIVYLSQSPHSAGGHSGALHTISVNTRSAVEVALAAAESGVRRFVYTSSGTVYGPSFEPLCESSPLRRDSWYTLSKVHAEEALSLLSGCLGVTVARPFAVYGPAQSGRLLPKLVETIASGQMVTITPRDLEGGLPDDGGLRISLCHVEDAADALLHFAVAGGPPYVNISASEALSIRDIAQALGRAIGKAPNISVDSKPRSFDLIASTDLLSRSCPVYFRPFADGLGSLLTSLPALAQV